MKIHIVAVGTKMPSWIQEGFAEYARRMPSECAVMLNEVPAPARTKTTASERAIREEGARMLAAIPKRAIVIALDVLGKQQTTEELAGRLQGWMGSGRDVAILIGGADGLSPDCLDQADGRWSLSKLTFPHPLVRVILAEQLYRAWSFQANHPYHRA